MREKLSFQKNLKSIFVGDVNFDVNFDNGFKVDFDVEFKVYFELNFDKKHNAGENRRSGQKRRLKEWEGP